MSIANELITRGWTQQPEVGPNGEVCLKRAAEYAYGGEAHSSLPYRVWETLCAVVGSDLPGCWNDYPGRTFDEVLRVAKEVDEILDAS